MSDANGHASKPPPVVNDEHLQRVESLIANLWTCRQDFLRQFMGQEHRDIDAACCWPEVLPAEFYRRLYDRNPIAERVVEVYPKECWQMTPLVYEDESAKNATKFEKAWDELGSNLKLYGESWYQDEEGSLIWSYLLRADIQSGIATYGLILLGLDDGKLLEEPVDGSKPDGVPKDISGVSDLTSKDIYGGQLPKALEQPLASTMGTDAQYFGVQFTPQQPQTQAKKARQLLFLRVFDESLVQVVQYEASMYNPRFGLPLMYKITLNDPKQPHTGIGLPLATVRVHWSRVIHVADNLQSSEIFGAPRMRAVVNNILDLRKLYGGSAEMYWRGAFPGLSIETHPQLGGDVIVDPEKLRTMLQNYESGLDRWMSLTGMSAKSLAPQVVDPTPQITCQLEAICIKLGCPVRVFKGSERGELASSQDDAAWNDRLRHRQKTHITPRIIVPFIDRLIQLGVLPKPKQYCVEWPDLDATTKKDKAAIALQTTQAIAAYVAGSVEQVLPPHDYYTRVLGWDEEEAEEVLEAAEEAQAEKEEEHQQLADEQGFEPAPPPGFAKPPPPAPPGFPPVAGKGAGMPSAGGTPKTKAEQSSQTQQAQAGQPTKPQAPARNVHHTPEHDAAYDEDGVADDGRKDAKELLEKKRYGKLREDMEEEYRAPHVASIDVERKQKKGEIPYGTEDVIDPPRPTGKAMVKNGGFWLGLAEGFVGSVSNVLEPDNDAQRKAMFARMAEAKGGEKEKSQKYTQKQSTVVDRKDGNGDNVSGGEKKLEPEKPKMSETTPEKTNTVPLLDKKGLSHDFQKYGLNQADAKTFHRIVEDKLFAYANKVNRGKTGNPKFDEDDSRWLGRLAGSAEKASAIVSQFGLQLQ